MHIKISVKYHHKKESNMEKLFINIFQMSISASYLILAVLLVRFLLRKAPKGMRSFLWMLVGIRLLIPFSVESVFSLIPNTQAVDAYIYETAQPKMNTISNITDIEPSVSQPVSGTVTPSARKHVSKTQIAIQTGTKIWVIGMALMFGYMLISSLKLKRHVRMSVPADVALDCSSTNIYQKIYQNSTIESPFLFGILKPRIYVPDCIADKELPYVVWHELTHLRRRDYLIKPAGFLLLSVYWFNPFVWTAYIMLCKDIELICDEKVIKKLGESSRKAYSQALLDSSVNRRVIAGCPVAFGEVSVKERVKNVLNYKKPAFWGLAAAVLACMIVPVCFMTQKKADNPENSNDFSETIPSEDINIENLFAGSYEMLNPDQDKYLIVPSLELQKDGRFSFFYDPLSSYACVGKYDWTEDILHMVTDDGKYQYQFTYDDSLLLFDAEESSDISGIDKKRDVIAPVEDGSIFFKNNVSAVLNSVEEMSQTFNQELEQDTALTTEQLRSKQVSLSELQKQLTMGEMRVQWQLDKIKELQLSQEKSTALEARLQELLQESDTVMQQLEKDLDTCQSAMNTAENIQTVYQVAEQWAQAFCGRDGETIVRLADEETEQDLTDRNLLLHGSDDGKTYTAFGWSSPWPWGGNFDENTTAKNYRILNVTDHSAEILYYAWVSNPHVTVWQELLSFTIENDECIVTSESLQFMDGICTAAEFRQAYPDGITGTMMDYASYNASGEALNHHATSNRDDQWYGKLLEPDSAAVTLLNILKNPNKVGVHVTQSDTNTCTVTFDFYEDGNSVSVQMIQPYGSDGIWVPYTGDSDTLDGSGDLTDESTPTASKVITGQNVDAVIAEDAKQLDALFPEHHESVSMDEFPKFADLDGDGIEEKIEMVNLLYNGGDGGYALKVTDTKTGKQIPLPDGYTEEDGFPIFSSYAALEGEDPMLLIQLGEEKRCITVAAVTQDALIRIYERNHLYDQPIDNLLNRSSEMVLADALSGCSIVAYNQEETPVIVLKTYVSGLGGHADTLGYVITELKLQKDHTWSSMHSFVLDSCDDRLLQLDATEKSTENSGTWFLPYDDSINIDIIPLMPNQYLMNG